MDRKLESSSKPSDVLKNPCSKTTMEKLFKKRSQTGDIKFIVDGVEIRAHRCILAALSPRYEAQFYGAMADKDTITVEDVSPAAFKEFLQFFYMDEIELTLDNIEDVLNLAKQSLVDELVAECTNFLMNNIGVEKLLWCYELALAYDVNALEAFCVKQIGTNIKTLFKSAEFISCERAVLCRILDFDSLNCKETDVFDACIAWAKAKCERCGVDAADTVNLRIALNVALYKIRFCSMSIKELANISRQYAGLLSAQEATEVLQAIALKGNGVHSKRFGANNSVPRESIKFNLECFLAKEPSILIDLLLSHYVIELSTDKAIALNGFVLCQRIHQDINVGIKVGNKERFYPKNTKTTSENETKIIFGEPIQIEANECTTVDLFRSSFLSPTCGRHGYNLRARTTQHGVAFDITQFKLPNLIERLLFNIVDKN